MDRPTPSVSVYEVRLIAGFQLLRSASTVPVPVSLQRLIAFLALRGPTPRRTIAGVLWQSTSDDRAMASLRTAVWRLQGAARGLLTQSADSLTLHPKVTVDVALIDGAASADKPIALAARPCADLLPGWYDDWVIMDRERLRHRHIRLLESVAAAAIDAGNQSAALDWALAAAAADPLRESAHRLVIRSLLADGNVHAARRHFALVQDILREQLGVAPSYRLAALFRHVRRGTPRMSRPRQVLPLVPVP